MAKVGLITPRPEDTRFRARIARFFLKLRGSGGDKPPQGNPGLLIPCSVTFVVTGILSFALLINILPPGWLTVTQMALASVASGIIASIIVAVFLFNAMNLMRNAFIAAAGATLVATIGWGIAVSVSQASGPTDVVVGTRPLQGQSLLAAIFIVVLMFLAYVFDARRKGR
ncbi:hypothetical protein I6F11_24060 [Ensifer sp. NBAIM29]|nr:hypothetical protein [Ensifer sp. NBAIM29]